ncbi:hypothetical protein, partial [Pseudomonas sp. N040]|uniref:hypothetical protein n=1 Tax=Pseudomonas sp. N040 TaxID=2785325 RepID=UPI0018A27CC4
KPTRIIGLVAGRVTAIKPLDKMRQVFGSNRINLIMHTDLQPIRRARGADSAWDGYRCAQPILQRVSHRQLLADSVEKVRHDFLDRKVRA